MTTTPRESNSANSRSSISWDSTTTTTTTGENLRPIPVQLVRTAAVAVDGGPPPPTTDERRRGMYYLALLDKWVPFPETFEDLPDAAKDSKRRAKVRGTDIKKAVKKEHIGSPQNLRRIYNLK